MNGVFAATASLPLDSAEGFLRGLRAQHPTLIVQLLAMDSVPPGRAVAMIAEQTLRARRTGAMLADKPEVDLLLRLAGTNQISAAIEKAGYRSGGAMVLVAAGPSPGIRALRRELSGDGRIAGLPDQELDGDALDLVDAAALLGTKT